MPELASSQSNTQKLNEILRRLEGGPEASLHNIEVLTEKILGDVEDIKKKVDRLEVSVIIGNGEPPLKEQVHKLQREVKDNTDKLDCHIKDDKTRVKEETEKEEKKKDTNWTRVFTVFFQITGAASGIIAAYLAYKLGVP